MSECIGRLDCKAAHHNPSFACVCSRPRSATLPGLHATGHSPFDNSSEPVPARDIISIPLHPALPCYGSLSTRYCRHRRAACGTMCANYSARHASFRISFALPHRRCSILTRATAPGPTDPIGRLTLYNSLLLRLLT